MLFNSFPFVFFFVIVTSLYYTIPHKYRWSLLLAVSCYFYMAFVPVHILILGFTIVVGSVSMLVAEYKNGKYKTIASDYLIENTSWRVLKLIMGNAKLSNRWHGIYS